MKAGNRFWHLVALVIVILAANGLASLHDAVQEGQKQLDSQRQILLRQQDLLRNTQWFANLKEVETLQEAWLQYLPKEDSVAVAKANLLNDMRALAQSAGMANLSLTATEVEEAESAGAARAYGGKMPTAYGAGKSGSEALPAGVRLIKVKLNGRFDPSTINLFLRALEDGGRSTVIERVSVRGTQVELNLRCYWQPTSEQSPATTTLRKTDTSLIRTQQ